MNELIVAALKAEEEEFIGMRWLVEGQSRMMPLNEYRALFSNEKPSNKSADEILADVERMMNGVSWTEVKDGNI